LADTGLFQQGRESVDAQLPALLECPGLLGPALGVLQGSEHPQDGVGEVEIADAAGGWDAGGYASAAAGGVVGDARGACDGGHLFLPAPLHLIEEIADAQGMEIVVLHLGTESGDVGMPGGLLVRGERAGFGRDTGVLHRTANPLTYYGGETGELEGDFGFWILDFGLG
jgi:hypothetical protein